VKRDDQFLLALLENRRDRSLGNASVIATISGIALAFVVSTHWANTRVRVREGQGQQNGQRLAAAIAQGFSSSTSTTGKGTLRFDGQSILHCSDPETLQRNNVGKLANGCRTPIRFAP